MTLSELCGLVDGKIIVDIPDTNVKCVYVSDLLSDVMAHAEEDSVLITIQNHLNTIAVCTLVGINIIVICHNRTVPNDMIEAAKREGVAIVVTNHSQFAAALSLNTLQDGTK